MKLEERIDSTSSVTLEEVAEEVSLRPQMLKQYIGQDQLKANLEITIQAARARGEGVSAGRPWPRRGGSARCGAGSQVGALGHLAGHGRRRAGAAVR